MRKFSVSIFLLFCQTAFGAFESLDQAGPGAQGMANACTGLVQDTGALLLNPAGLMDLSMTSVQVSGSLLYPGISVNGNYKAMVLAGMPLLNWVTPGAGFIYLSSYHYSELAAFVGAGFRPLKNLSLGLTIKMMRWSGDIVTINDTVVQSLGATVLCVDAGLKFSPVQGLSFGASAKNINGPILSSSSSGFSEELPREYVFGLGFTKDLWDADFDVCYRSGLFDYRLGGEINLLNKFLILRLGAVFFELGASGFEANAGFSLNLPVLKKNIRIDYSTGLNQASPFLSSHNIAFTFAI